jgi:hypothetical protein
MKNKIIGIVLGFVTFITFASLVSNAAPFPLQEVGGGTATNATSTAGQILISTGSSTYTPGFINCSGGCAIVSASGTVTIIGAAPISSTLPFSFANASGSWTYIVSNDGNFLEINTTGTIPGTKPVPYNIVLQNCPLVATTSPAVTSSSWECALSQAENFPDGSRSFVDWDTEYYPTGTNPNIASGWFDNERGTSSILFPFDLSWNDGSVNHVGFTEYPTVTTSATQLDAQFNLGTNGQLFVGTKATSTGAFVVNQNGASTCAGIYDSGVSTIYGLTDSLPAPAGCTALGGYYNGLAIQGTSSGTGTPIAGILNSSESSNGRGHTAFTWYDTNEVDTYNNELDDGSGNGFVAGTLAVGTSSVHGAQLYVNGKISATDLVLTDVALQGGIVKTDSSGNFSALGLSKGSLISSNGISTASTLAVGSNGQLLTASSGASLGVAWISPTWLVAANNLSDLTNTSTARTNLGLGATAPLGVGTGLTSSGGNLNVAATVMSSSVTFNISSATTTAGFNIWTQVTPNQKNITNIDCAEQATATSTEEIAYATSTQNALAGNVAQVILASIVCTKTQTSTTSFTTSTLPAGDVLMVITSSTVGTPVHLNIDVIATKQ